MGSSVSGSRGARLQPVWRKGMTMTIGAVSTIILVVCKKLTPLVMYGLSHKTPGYCWSTPKYRNWCAQHAFFEGKKAEQTSPRKRTSRTLKEIDQQYPAVLL